MQVCSAISSTGYDNLLFVALSPELLEVSPKVAGLFFVLYARKNHFGIRNLGSRILDVILECRLIPGDSGILVRVRIAVVGDRTGMSALKAVEHGSHVVCSPISECMAGQACLERLFAGGYVLCLRARRQCDHNHCDCKSRFHYPAPVLTSERRFAGQTPTSPVRFPAVLPALCVRRQMAGIVATRDLEAGYPFPPRSCTDVRAAGS